ncbi:unnamed protein product [Acanthoscelides obtectus]|uniref:Uncharacterized protein n=1 Tax=Acanthoscelides obtectus TaxID=200917 RepID=A0A9P0LPV6_ACAOB|nr:unnamed protein product [Acanthoscelides obtectus]CAK1650173.1 hypothetical protein AOBTE_LOCUS16658 [Acanthoscelides obtectus]
MNGQDLEESFDIYRSFGFFRWLQTCTLHKGTQLYKLKTSSVKFRQYKYLPQANDWFPQDLRFEYYITEMYAKSCNRLQLPESYME